MSDEPGFWATEDGCTFTSSEPKARSVLLTKIYYSEGIQIKTGKKGKVHSVESEGNHMQASKSPFAEGVRGVTRDVFHFSKDE